MSCCWPKSSSNTTLVVKRTFASQNARSSSSAGCLRGVEPDGDPRAVRVVGLGIHVPQLGVAAHRQVDRHRREQHVDDRAERPQLPFALRPLEQARDLLAHHHRAGVGAEVLAHQRRREHVRAPACPGAARTRGSSRGTCRGSASSWRRSNPRARRAGASARSRSRRSPGRARRARASMSIGRRAVARGGPRSARSARRPAPGRRPNSPRSSSANASRASGWPSSSPLRS